MNLAVDLGHTSFLADLEELSAQLNEHEQRLRLNVDRAERYHVGVKDVSVSIGDQFEEVRRQLSILRDKHDRADGLLAEGKAALMLLHERLRQVESFTAEVPMLRADLDEKVQEVRDLGKRLQKIEEGVSATVERIGGAEGFETLQSLPEKIRNEAEQARDELSNMADRLVQQMQEQLATVSDPGVREVGEAVNRILEAGQRQLNAIEMTVTHATERLTSERQAQLEAQREEWEKMIEASRAEAQSLREEMESRVAQCTETIDDATGTIEGKLERWMEESIQEILGSEREDWRSEVRKSLDDASAQLTMDRIAANSRINQIERAHKSAVKSLRRWVVGLGLLAVLLLGATLLLMLDRQEPRIASVAVVRPEPVVTTPAPNAPIVPPPSEAPVAVEELPAIDEQPVEMETVPPAADPAPRFSWVVVSTTSRSEAEEIRSSHLEAGHQSHIIEAVVNGAPRYRVTLGSYATSADAQAARSTLGSVLPADAWVLEAAR